VLNFSGQASFSKSNLSFANHTIRDRLTTSRQNEMQRFRVVSGNQKFYSLPFSTLATRQDLEKRGELVAQLLSATSSPAAVQALQSAETFLKNAWPAEAGALARISSPP